LSHPLPCPTPFGHWYTIWGSGVPTILKRAISPVSGACLLFFLIGCLLLPQLGIQTDEAIFVAGIYQPEAAYYKCQILGRPIPLMLLSYLGTLKSLIYAVVFAFCTPTAASTRIPVLLIGVLTIWIFSVLLNRVAGRAAALAAAVLLATDPTFLLTDLFDWGPVALQHLLLVAGMLALYRHYETERRIWIAAGCCLFGLAMWDKAVFIWSLTAMAVAGVLIFPRTLWRLANRRAAGVGLLAFGIGAWPLIWFNIERRGETFHGTAVYSTAAFGYKLSLAAKSLAGGGLYRYLAREDFDGAAPLEADDLPARAAEQISRLFRHCRYGLLPALLASLVLIPFWWRARVPSVGAVLFALVCSLLIFLAMALNAGTGWSVHHTVLLWPFPHLAVAVMLARVAQKFVPSGRALAAGLLVLVAFSNLLVLNEYYRLMRRNGGGLPWTDAIYPLSRLLKTIPASQIMPIDWGIFDNLRLLSAGALPIRSGIDDNPEAVRQWLRTPMTVFVSHTDANQIFRGVNQRLDAIARADGLRRDSIQVVADRNGRPIFQVFRYKSSRE
jgi:Dolichyl-phosphate-mannose-protein mannosyltransferase